MTKATNPYTAPERRARIHHWAERGAERRRQQPSAEPTTDEVRAVRALLGLNSYEFDDLGEAA